MTTENKELKAEPVMLSIEMASPNLDQYTTTVYKQILNDVTTESLASIATMFRISRHTQWAETAWNMSNVLITDKTKQTSQIPLKDAVKNSSINSENCLNAELKLPNLRVIFTDGYRQYSVICSISTKLGLIDQWMKSTNESIWFKKSLIAGNIVYYEVPTTMVQTLRQLSLNQILFDLYGPTTVYIYVKSKDFKIQNPILNMYESREQTLLNELKQFSQKKENIKLASWFALELRENLPKILEVNEYMDPTIQYDKEGILNWDILITDNQRSFRIDRDMLPNAIVAVIDCQTNITTQLLSDIEKKLSAGRKNTAIQCLISFQQTMDEKSLLFEKIMSMQDTPGPDLILMLGICAFVRLPDIEGNASRGKYIYLKDNGICLQSLYYLISRQMVQNNPIDISSFVGLTT